MRLVFAILFVLCATANAQKLPPLSDSSGDENRNVCLDSLVQKFVLDHFNDVEQLVKPHGHAIKIESPATPFKTMGLSNLGGCEGTYVFEDGKSEHMIFTFSLDDPRTRYEARAQSMRLYREKLDYCATHVFQDYPQAYSGQFYEACASVIPAPN